VHSLVFLCLDYVLLSRDEIAQQKMAGGIPSLPVLLDVCAHHHLLMCVYNLKIVTLMTDYKK
jgi:hypothetical protein